MDNNVASKRADKRRLQELENFAKECCESYEKREKRDYTLPEPDLASNSGERKNENFDTTTIVASEYSRFDDFSESEEEIVLDQPEIQDIKAIKAWVIDNSISHEHVDKLLPILKRRLLPQIPKTAKNLLKWDVNNLDNTANMEVSDASMDIQKTVTNPNNDISSNVELADADFEFFVTKTLTAIAKDVADIKARQEIVSVDIDYIKARQNETVSFLLDTKVTKVTDVALDFTTKYQYSFPITSIERFLEFDKDLENNKFLRFDVSVQLCDLLDPDLVITKSLLKMVRFFITKEVAEKFTAIRIARNQSEERNRRFITTALYGIMCGVIKFQRSKKALEVSDKLILKGISDVFCNCRNWN